MYAYDIHLQASAYRAASVSYQNAGVGLRERNLASHGLCLGRQRRARRHHLPADHADLAATLATDVQTVHLGVLRDLLQNLKPISNTQPHAT